MIRLQMLAKQVNLVQRTQMQRSSAGGLLLALESTGKGFGLEWQRRLQSGFMCNYIVYLRGAAEQVDTTATAANQTVQKPRSTNRKITCFAQQWRSLLLAQSLVIRTSLQGRLKYLFPAPVHN